MNDLEYDSKIYTISKQMIRKEEWSEILQANTVTYESDPDKIMSNELHYDYLVLNKHETLSPMVFYLEEEDNKYYKSCTTKSKLLECWLTESESSLLVGIWNIYIDILKQESDIINWKEFKLLLKKDIEARYSINQYSKTRLYNAINNNIEKIQDTKVIFESSHEQSTLRDYMEEMRKKHEEEKFFGV